MKTLTKEWVKDIEFHDLLLALNPMSDKKVPFVFTNGGTESVAKEDLHTVKTHFNSSGEKDEISFILLPDTFDLETDLLCDGEVINDTTRKNDFQMQYLNRLRVISYLPDDILKRVKDKRLLALGYAESEIKKEILDYATEKYKIAYDLSDVCDVISALAEKGLTIYEQLKKHMSKRSVSFLFDGVQITKAETDKDNIYLTLDDFETVVFSGAEVIEKEVDILNCFVRAIELYKTKNGYELHFLLDKFDKNLIEQHYYVTYSFKDLKFKD